ncbi:MAG TPA: cobalamin-independent methionine synthase II family protein [Beijerinckiaceae bacterium]|nr:cobalamin-independent methionine synthase II family protein [Beijerinckiaceae bacterium]
MVADVKTESMASDYRCDQVGSLLRPPYLLDARDDFKAGRIDRAALRAAEDKAVLDVLQVQKDAGMAIFTDGEMRRDSWQTVFSEAVDGFEENYPLREFKRPDGSVARLQMHTKAITGKVRQKKRLADVDAAFLRQHAPGPFKITMPSPAMTARQSYRRGDTDKAYPDADELRSDIGGIVTGEMRALAGEGCAYIQLDEGFTIYADPARLTVMTEEGLDADQALEEDIALENACYDAVRRPGLTLAMHLCRGSRSGFMRGKGGYDWLAERLFDRLHVDRYLLEYDSDKVGGFEPLRHLPKGKVAVLGLVSSTNPRLETRDELLRRIESAIQHCPIERLAISSQCGFQGAATRDGAHMSFDDQRRKLERIGEVAQEVWG